MTYDPVAYWTVRGRTFEAETVAKGWTGETPELMDLLERLRPRSVLELGCGWGRNGVAIARRWPRIRYSGVDVSGALIESACGHLPEATFWVADLATWTTDLRFDVVMAISTLGHLLPPHVPTVLDRMRKAARHDVIVIDWDDTGAATEYQFAHDYRALMPNATRTDLGRLSLYHEHVR